jgi:hypothetical protein
MSCGLKIKEVRMFWAECSFQNRSKILVDLIRDYLCIEKLVLLICVFTMVLLTKLSTIA